MKAVVLKEVGLLQVEQRTTPSAKADEVLVRVELAGICGSDNSMFHGKLAAPLPVTPGHEAVGRIEALGSGVKTFSIGQRVTIHPNYYCGACPMCKKGLTNICHNKIRLGVDIDGVFAEYVVVPAAALYPLPETLASEIAVFAEPLSVAVHAVKQTPLKCTDRVLVFGAGVIGQLTLQAALLETPNVSACDLVAARLELAQSLGADRTFGAQESLDDFEAAFDVIFETSGAPAGLELAIKLAVPGGTIVLLGLPGTSHPISTMQIVRKELHILGSMIYTDEFPRSIELLAQSKIRTAPLVSGIIPLEELSDSLLNFSAPQRMKTLVTVR
jgi:2-desacetyl-2-hydroxyethyl bacteriochlorophyllide A dehydrogenase